MHEAVSYIIESNLAYLESLTYCQSMRLNTHFPSHTFYILPIDNPRSTLFLSTLSPQLAYFTPSTSSIDLEGSIPGILRCPVQPPWTLSCSRRRRISYRKHPYLISQSGSLSRIIAIFTESAGLLLRSKSGLHLTHIKFRKKCYVKNHPILPQCSTGSLWKRQEMQ